jgi:hypothetical protein
MGDEVQEFPVTSFELLVRASPGGEDLDETRELETSN